MLEKLKHLRHLVKLKPIRNYTNKFIYPYLKFLVFSIILLSLFVGRQKATTAEYGCL